MGLELEVRPLAVTGLIFHLGQARTPPYLQLQVTEKQVSLAGVAHQGWVCLSILVTLGACPDPPFLPRQVLLRADDGAGEFSTSVTRPSVLCDGQWHRLAGEAPPVARALCHSHPHSSAERESSGTLGGAASFRAGERPGWGLPGLRVHLLPQ